MLSRSDVKSLATRLRHRVDIKSKEEISNGAGGFIEAWVTIATVWAAVDPIKASQVYQYNSINVEATHHILMRGSIPITEDQIIEFNNRQFEILTIENIQERDIFFFITVKERR